MRGSESSIASDGISILSISIDREPIAKIRVPTSAAMEAAGWALRMVGTFLEHQTFTPLATPPPRPQAGPPAEAPQPAACRSPRRPAVRGAGKKKNIRRLRRGRRLGKGKEQHSQKVAKTEKGSAPNRNKVCSVCKRAFYDETRTNCRKFCGEGGCRYDGGKPIPGADVPRDASGRALDLNGED
jgi:hypothetical protein